MDGVGVILTGESQIPQENWERVEEAAMDIVNRIHPTVESHCKRKEVIEYLQALIQSFLGCEIFPYGSVPLKTYLPDGDIDLTIICHPAVEDAMVAAVHTILRQEQQNRNAPYEVKDVYFIDAAEVKLVKCIVRNIVIDISVNQLGGLSTLCYLEQVDQIVGRDHLFKRSILLIKAWCYFESRTLGSYHGLISTYALETLILYILHLFHNSLSGPLAVLYKFLDYFGKFDWKHYCISLYGRVSQSDLPNIVVEPLENRGELLLSDEFLRRCVGMFSVWSTNPEINSRPFPVKHLNIVDPLKANNNLGRSVNKASFHRIQSAFKYGARKLGRILSLPCEKMINELNRFFENTLCGHGSNYWTHMQNPCMACASRNSDNSSLSSLSDTSHLQLSYSYGENGKFDGALGCTSRSEYKENYFVVNNSACSSANNEDKPLVGSATKILVNNSSENLTPTVGEREYGSITETSQTFKSILDLNGDYECHLKSVLYGQYCQFYAENAPTLFFPLMAAVCQYLQLKQNVQSQMRTDGVFRQQQYSLNPPAQFSASVDYDRKEKRRGTGTYIPRMSYPSYRGRPSSGKWKYQTRGRNGEPDRYTHDNWVVATPQKGNCSKSSHELSEAEYPYLGNAKPLPSKILTPQSSVWGSSSADAFSPQPESIASEFQSLQLHEESLPERITPNYAGVSCTTSSTSIPITTAAERSETVSENEHERVAVQPYCLKDEVDFPPLFQGRAMGI
ncbi:uncharacterized protein LOC122722410 [Manihot esculenta]|uniref:Polymerase nucleotidyl transferase domain-containing protein n=1 Tax=Manihot esculenta TaxID=3983 RepID=A0A2C9U362_MANES|nr:uncharacterized protein LOC122722410 [Manihot esculenta]OAY24159.1 hypothetical protein MANES_18G139200v8 [Manihot esculenta]